MSLDDAKERDLERIDAHTFSVKGTTTQIRCEPGSKKQRPRLVQKQGDASAETFERFEPVTVAAEELQAYAGRYESDEIASDLSLGVREGQLVVATYGRAPTVRLRPLIADGFEGNGVGFHFERDERGQIAGFVLNANRIHGIHWKRR
jgi:hypothetical protein